MSLKINRWISLFCVPVLFHMSVFALAAADPARPESKLQQADALFASGKLEAALAMYGELLESIPDSASLHIRRADCYRRLKQYDKALIDAERAASIDPENVDVWETLGLIHVAKGDAEKALRQFDRAVQVTPDEPAMYYRRGELLFEMDEFDRAVRDFSRVIELDPDNAAAWCSRGACRVAQRKFGVALGDLGTAIDLDERFVLAYVTRGAARLKFSDSDGALHDFARVIELDPENPTPYVLRAAIWTEREEFARAEQELTALLKHRPRHGTAWLLRGDARKSQGQYASAISDYRKAAALEGRNQADGHARLAFVLACCKVEEHRDYRAAIRHARTRCEMTGYRDWLSLALLATTYAQADRFREATYWQAECLKLAPFAELEDLQKRLDLYQQNKPFYSKASKMED